MQKLAVLHEHIVGQVFLHVVFGVKNSIEEVSKALIKPLHFADVDRLQATEIAFIHFASLHQVDVRLVPPRQFFEDIDIQSEPLFLLHHFDSKLINERHFKSLAG